MAVIRGFSAQNVVACFEEPNQLGDVRDFDAPRNAPAKFPHQHLPLIAWHSDFFQYQLLVDVQTVTVNHAAVPSKIQTWSTPDGGGFIVIGDTAIASHTLVTHGLGYEPLAFVIKDGQTVIAGRPVQHLGDQLMQRTVSPFVDNNVVGLHEVGISGFAIVSGSPAARSLPAISITYDVMIFAVSETVAGEALARKSGSRLVLARGRIDSDYKYARQVALIESHFSMDLGPSVDIANGGARYVSGGESWTDINYAGSYLGPRFTRIGY